MSEQPHPTEETDARQGRTGTGLRWVLRISLALVVVAFAVIWLSYAGRGHEESPPKLTSATASSVKEAAATPSAGSAAAQRGAQTSGG